MPLCASSDDRRAPFDLESLARALAAADRRFVVWKGGRDLRTQGDLDCAAPRGSWEALAEAFTAWARVHGLASLIACAHARGMLVLVGCGGSAGRRLLQVDLVDAVLVHGVPAWTADDAAFATTPTDGVSHTLPGAEGVLRRLAHRSDVDAGALIAADAPGAELLARRLGLRGKLAAHAIGPGRRIVLETLLAARAFVHPLALAASLRSDPARRACPVLRALRNDRMVEGSTQDWLADAGRNHDVRRLAPHP
jgi:hypothetical protein